MKAYIRVKNKLGVEIDCRGYDFYCEYFAKTRGGYEDEVFVTEDYRHEIFNSVLNSSFVPQKGMKVYVEPGCPIAMADIRKNYVVKRKKEDADFMLVHSKERNWRSWDNFDQVIVLPEKKAVFAQYKYNNNGNLSKYVAEVFPDFWKMDFSLVYNVSGDFTFNYYDIEDVELPLKVFESISPCPVVYYTNLPIEADNKLNIEVLEMLMKVGQTSYDSNGEQNFKLQLQALNQTDWRDYPGTLGMIYNTLYHDKRTTNATEGFKRPSMFPKAIKELCATMRDQKEFASEKDRSLARAFLEKTCEFSTDKYYKIEDLTKKFANNRISFLHFYSLYDNLVKIRPHVSESEA